MTTAFKGVTIKGNLGWQVIVDAKSMDELKNAVPLIDDIPVGTEVKIRLDYPWYANILDVGHLTDVVYWNNQLSQADIKVTKIDGGVNWLEVTGIAQGSPVMPVVWAIVAICAAFGVYWITRAIIVANITKQKEIALVDRMIDEDWTPEQINGVLTTMDAQTKSSELSWLPVALGAVVIIGAVVFFLLRR